MLETELNINILPDKCQLVGSLSVGGLHGMAEDLNTGLPRTNPASEPGTSRVSRDTSNHSSAIRLISY